MFVISVVTILALIVRTGAQFPGCGNYNDDNGYPAGCVYSGNDLCVVQDQACTDLICGLKNDDLKQKIRDCNVVCEPGMPQPNTVCDCLDYSMRQCPAPGSPPSSSSWQNYLANTNNYLLESRNTEQPWGGRFTLPDETLQIVYCQGGKDPCNLEESLCIQGPCLTGECYFPTSGNCYFVKTHTVNVREDPDYEKICDTPGSFAVVIENALERQFVFDLLGESATASSWEIWTAGKVPAGSAQAEWIDISGDPGNPIDPEVYPNELTPGNNDRYLTVKVDDCGASQWGLSDSNTASVVLCEVPAIGRPPDDSTTSTTEVPTSESTTDASTSSTADDTTSTTSTTTTTTETSLPECGLTCKKNGSYGELWCCAVGQCSQKCPLNSASGQIATWTCEGSDFTTPSPNYTACSSQWLGGIQEEVENGNITSDALLDILTNNVTSDNIYASEIQTVLDLTNTAMDLLIKEQLKSNSTTEVQLQQRRNVTIQAMDIVYKLTNLEAQWQELDQDEEARVELGVHIQDTIRQLGFNTTQLARQIGSDYSFRSGQGHNFSEFQFVNYSKDRGGSVLRFPMSEAGSSIELRDYQGLLETGETSVGIEAVGNAFSKEQADIVFPHRRNGDSRNNTNKKFNSEMVSLSLRGPDGEPLSTFHSSYAIGVALAHDSEAFGTSAVKKEEAFNKCRDKKAQRGTAYCAFWNTTAGSNSTGAWDANGCRMDSSNRSHTTCSCNHLSSFAVLMDIREYGGFNIVTDVLSKVCSGLSMAALLMTFCVLQFVNELTGDRNNIGKNLCACLFVAHFFSLILLDEDIFCLNDMVDSNGIIMIPGGCVAIGAITHYFFLVAFMWMGIEGFHLYRLVVHVFDSGRDHTLVYMAVAYGVPAIIVGVTLAVGFGADGESPYGRDGICWLSTPNYIWSFIGPVVAICVANLVVLIMAMRVAASARGQKNKSFMTKAKSWIRGWFLLSSMLGITWLFGFIYILIDKNLEYVYIILTGLQGVFILLAKVVLNKQVSRALRRTVEKSSVLSKFYSSMTSKSTTGSGFTSKSGNSSSAWLQPNRESASTTEQPRDSSSSSASYWDHEASRAHSVLQHPQADAYTGGTQVKAVWHLPPAPLPPPLHRGSMYDPAGEDYALYGHKKGPPPRPHQQPSPKALRNMEMHVRPHQRYDDRF